MYVNIVRAHCKLDRLVADVFLLRSDHSFPFKLGQQLQYKNLMAIKTVPLQKAANGILSNNYLLKALVTKQTDRTKILYMNQIVPIDLIDSGSEMEPVIYVRSNFISLGSRRRPPF